MGMRSKFRSLWRSRFKQQPSRSVAPLQDRLPDDVGRLQISCCGLSWCEIEPHVLVQRIPLPSLRQWHVDPTVGDCHCLCLKRSNKDEEEQGELVRIALNLAWPSPERAQEWQANLAGHAWIWDPDPERVAHLRALALPAHWLDPEAPINDWLSHPLAADPTVWERRLGFAPPRPDALLVLGQAGADWDRQLALEASQTSFAPADAQTVASLAIDYRPGWPELIATSALDGWCRAGWLEAALHTSARVVPTERSWLPDLLWHQAGYGVPLLLLPPQATPAELRAIHRGAPLRALAEDRPSPPVEELFHWNGHDPAAIAPGAAVPTVAVLVSLYNYGDRIEAALESVAAQTTAGLELIVVDDASGDDGAARVQDWMASRTGAATSGSPTFARLLLLRHRRNAGLAAARNSAFAAARAPWCFVLDADNALFPAAVAACLALANSGAEDLAVVHPLLSVEAEPGRPDDQRSLVSTASWQRSRLLSGNVVDAMALVRRSAWQAVGGYTHIEGGWEDYDFWCKLVGAGWHGVQCPQILAVYRSHAASMSHTATNRSWRALSRTLQDRHPWLELPLATP